MVARNCRTRGARAVDAASKLWPSRYPNSACCNLICSTIGRVGSIEHPKKPADGPSKVVGAVVTIDKNHSVSWMDKLGEALNFLGASSAATGAHPKGSKGKCITIALQILSEKRPLLRKE